MFLSQQTTAIKKDSRAFYLDKTIKLKGFSWYVKREKNYVQSLVIFAYITANMAVILNNNAIN